MARPRSAQQARSPVANPKAAIQDWLTLVDPDGAFLTTTELAAVFPHGFEPMPADRRTELRARVADLGTDATDRSDLRTWLLGTALDWDDQLVDGQAIPSTASARAPEHGIQLRPDLALLDVESPTKVRLGVFVWPLGTSLDRRTDVTVAGDTWPASPIQRAETWCRESNIPLALVTDDDQWILVWAPRGAPAASCRWRVGDLADERILQSGLVALLGARRFFAVADDETLEALFERAANAEAEVTKGLGSSVRRSVELLVAAISRDDVASGGKVLDGVASTEVYESAVTVLMRLVFLLFAEERRLLPAEDPLWAESYSVLTLRDDLRTASVRDGEDALERRSTAWHRLLATFRAVHGGVNHDRLTLPAYGGSLFDPDRFPFLEGRRAPDHLLVNDIDLGPAADAASGPDRPVAIDDRTVLAILDALLTVEVKSGRTRVAQRVSYKALDVEQIGHCYEGLLDHGCAPVDELAIGLIGPEGNEPEFTITELEAHLAAGPDSLCEWLSDKTRCNKKATALEKLLQELPSGVDLARLRVACGHDDDTVARVLPYWGLIRQDLRSLPVVLLPGSQFVTQTSTRRNMGAQYTTKALAEEVVQYALEPLVYEPGPQDEADPSKWKLRTPAEIIRLRVCDPAVGSGAILTAAGRYLADRLVESVVEHGPGSGPFAGRLAELGEAPADEQTVLARREVVDHCLYGVDKNPVAAEMAKLSLWLTTMARERPFTFLDHAIQVGDSLLGITDVEQLRWLHLDPDERKGKAGFTTLALDLRLKEAADLARRLQELSVVTVRDATEKQRLHEELRGKLVDLSVVADAVVGASLSTAGSGGISMEQRLDTQGDRILTALDDDRSSSERTAALDVLHGVSTGWLRTDLPDEVPNPWDRRCLHWPLAFPEVFLSNRRSGFDAFVANPPYMGNKYWKERIGPHLQHMYASLIGRPLGKPDLMVLFMWRFRVLLAPGGAVGSLSTQSIAEVDSKVLMASNVLDGLDIHRALSAKRWPGDANVVVAILWLHQGEWSGDRMLDGEQVEGIGADLTAGSTAEPYLLAETLFAFQGVDNSRGLSFVVSAENPLAAHSDLFLPYISGEDLSLVDPRVPSKRVLDLTGTTEDELAALPNDVKQFLAQVVRPERSPQALRSYKGLEKRWWTFWNTRENGFARARQGSYCIAVPAVAKYSIPVRVPSSWVFTNMAIVIADELPGTHTLLLSSAFDVWAEKYGGTFGSGRRMKVGPIFGTFPLPDAQVSSAFGELWQSLAFEALDSHGPGLVDVMNAVHNPEIDTQVIREIRDCLVDVDREVARAYGWSKEGYSDRFDVAHGDRALLLKRLLELNHERYRAEVAAGLHDKKAKKTTAKRAAKSVDPSQETLL